MRRASQAAPAGSSCAGRAATASRRSPSCSTSTRRSSSPATRAAPTVSCRRSRSGASWATWPAASAAASWTRRGSRRSTMSGRRRTSTASRSGASGLDAAPPGDDSRRRTHDGDEEATAMMSGSQPMPPEPVAEELEEAEEVDRDAERARVALEEQAMAATDRNAAEADGVEADEPEKPGLIERLLDLVEGGDDAPETQTAEG